MTPPLHTPVCDVLGCEHAVVLAGMGGVARSELVAAVSEAGGFGFLGMVRENPRLIRDEIEKVRAGTTRDFGVNLIPAGTEPTLLDQELDAVIAARVFAVAFFWDVRTDPIKRLRDAGILVVHQVGSAREAEQAQVAGAQVLIAQGVQAGGHVRGTEPLYRTLTSVLSATDLPVLAAGGIADGKTAAAAFLAGAQGVVVGTAFLATTESFAHDYHKQRIVEAGSDDTVLTDVFHINWPRGAMVRVLRNSATAGQRGDAFAGPRKIIGHEEDRPIYLFSTDSPLRNMTGDFEAMALYAGEGAGIVPDMVPARERLARIVDETAKILATRDAVAPAEDAEPSSPVCYAGDADPVCMGYATRDELLAFLNEMLEAERAGARVALRASLETSDDKLRTLLHDVHRDEARWCALCLKWIGALDGKPSSRIGAFYEKAMGIPALPERIQFINRGQGWVVRKLREMLPKIRDDALHAELKAMLLSHEANIERANVVVSRVEK
jgi:nitronate monooxygenase